MGDDTGSSISNLGFLIFIFILIVILLLLRKIWRDTCSLQSVSRNENNRERRNTKKYYICPGHKMGHHGDYYYNDTCSSACRFRDDDISFHRDDQNSDDPVIHNNGRQNEYDIPEHHGTDHCRENSHQDSGSHDEGSGWHSTSHHDIQSHDCGSDWSSGGHDCSSGFGDSGGDGGNSGGGDCGGGD